MKFSFSIYHSDILFMSASLKKLIIDKRLADIEGAV